MIHIGAVPPSVCFRCAVNTGESDMDAVREAMEGFVDSLPGTGADLPSYTEVNVHEEETTNCLLSYS